MGAGDRGGMAALNRMSPRVDWSQLGRMIKKTRNPIMCICNDSGSQKALLWCFSYLRLKVRSLALGPSASSQHGKAQVQLLRPEVHKVLEPFHLSNC